MKIKAGDFFVIRWKRKQSFQVYIVDEKGTWFYDTVDNVWLKSLLMKPGQDLNKLNFYKVYRYSK